MDTNSRRGEKIVVVTAYDAPTARIEIEAGVDIILVGDSVGVNILGYAHEREVTLATAPAEPETPDAAEPPPPDWFNEDMQLQFAATLDDEPEEVTEIAMMFFPTGSSTGGLIQLSDSEREAWLYVDPLTGKLIIESRLDDLEDRLAEEGV